MQLDNLNRLYYFTSYIFLCGHDFICMLPGSLDASPRKAVSNDTQDSPQILRDHVFRGNGFILCKYKL